jgi:hypothetical protein
LARWTVIFFEEIGDEKRSSSLATVGKRFQMAVTPTTGVPGARSGDRRMRDVLSAIRTGLLCPVHRQFSHAVLKFSLSGTQCLISISRRNLMRKFQVAMLGLAILATAASSCVTPAFALGGCGPNRHRSSLTGRCIWGGQNQAWCLRHTGHAAVPGPGGTWVCLR